MPTIPSPRDAIPPSTGRSSSSSKAFTRSPGRTYSMSRLDQLSQPRKRPSELCTLAEQQTQNQNSAFAASSSMSRSMSHLAAAPAPQAANKNLKRSDNSRSMGTLPGPPTPAPRHTRAERLRRRARDQQQQGKELLRTRDTLLSNIKSSTKESFIHFMSSSDSFVYLIIPFHTWNHFKRLFFSHQFNFYLNFNEESITFRSSARWIDNSFFSYHPTSNDNQSSYEQSHQASPQ